MNQALEISLGLDNPLVLAVTLPLATLASLAVIKAKRRLDILKTRLPVSLSQRLYRVLLVAKLAPLYILAFAAATPYTILVHYVNVSEETVNLVKIPVTYVVLLDASLSMGYVDAGCRRFDASLAFTRGLLEELGEAYVIVFNETARVLCKPSMTVEECIARLESIKLGEFSAIGDAIVYASALAKKRLLAVIVVTDGGWNRGSNPVEVSKTLSKNMGIVFVVVGFDPRGFRLADELKKAHVKVYRLTSCYTTDIVKQVVEAASRSARAEALRAAGYTRIPIVEKDYTLTYVLIGVALALLIASFVEGW